MGTFGEWIANYTSFAGRFATASLWDDYLTFHYTGKPFDPGSADLSVVTPAQAALTDFAAGGQESAPAEGADDRGPRRGRTDHRARQRLRERDRPSTRP